ncbi:Mobile element protein [Methanosarcina horonobensis HB-1 = JCM 15518]|uniref:Mobile element protein n=1 Tax=Methanosarcina horonobensis HB-1 = JCM 15518 TaxID=1434110 RepID=A0A0E3SFD1_9EURY|nr:Mobile element protein [Methanosarcina horonobensis HB-1 = JCM 15518]
MTYLTSMKLSSSADKIIEKFEKDKAELIDSEKGIYGIKILKPNSIKYFCFSEALQEKTAGSKGKNCSEEVTGSKRDTRDNCQKQKASQKIQNKQ